MISKKESGHAGPPDSNFFLEQSKVTKETFLSQNHHAAVIYSQQYGFYVFPVVARGKQPLTQHGFKDATRDLDQIAQWWATWPEANVGISCGHSGLAVIDIDETPQMSAFDALTNVEHQFGQLPSTPHVLTGGGGFQFYFRSVEPLQSKNRILPNIDLKSQGGYVIAPPSTHYTGNRYVWESLHKITEMQLATVPKWVSELLGEKKEVPLRPSNFWSDLFHNGTTEGTRNESVTKLAGYLFRKNIDAFLVREIVALWNLTRVYPPLKADELERTIDSVARLEVKRRGGPDVIG